jgi:hypothetical protein
MTTKRMTIEFQRSTGIIPEGTLDPVMEVVDAEVLMDGESFQVDLPHGGGWACDQAELRAALA